MNNPGNEIFMKSAHHYISEPVRKQLGAVRMPKGAIVLAKVGAAVFLERKRILNQDSCIDNNMSAFIVDETVADTRYVHYLLMNFQVSSLVATTALPSLNGTQLRSIPLLLPRRLEEQRSIVSALTDTDHLINALTQLIAKKQAIKQGMMQQLLTGATRLPGFVEPWTVTTLGALGSFLKGRGVKRDDVRANGVPCVRYGELYTVFNDYTSVTHSFVEPEIAATALPLRSGDLLFAGSGETREEIGKCVAYIGEIPAVAGGDIVVLRGRADLVNPTYLALLANAPDSVIQKSRAGQGDAVVHISSRALAAVQVKIPNRSEQDAIAEVLTDAEAEVAALRSQLAKAEDVKAGMMQELLTGRTRLPIKETS